MLNRTGFARLGNDLLRSSNRLLLLALRQMRGAFARFIDHFLTIRVRLCQNLLVTLLRFSELLSDFFRVELAFFNLAASLLEHRKDWLVSEALQKERNNAEANDLRQKQLPIPAEGFSCFAQDVGHASATGGNYQVHKLGFGRNIDCLPVKISERDTARRKRSPRSTRWREFRARALA